MTTIIEPSRRRFLHILTGIIAAPAVVKAGSLMRVVAPPVLTKTDIINNYLLEHNALLDIVLGTEQFYRTPLPQGTWRRLNQ